MRNEPNVDTRVCRGEGAAGFNIALYGGDYGRRGYPADEMSHFLGEGGLSSP